MLHLNSQKDTRMLVFWVGSGYDNEALDHRFTVEVLALSSGPQSHHYYSRVVDLKAKPYSPPDTAAIRYSKAFYNSFPQQTLQRNH